MNKDCDRPAGSNEMAHSSGRNAGNVLSPCDTPQRPTAEGAPATPRGEGMFDVPSTPLPSARGSGTQGAGAQRPKADPGDESEGPKKGVKAASENSPKKGPKRVLFPDSKNVIENYRWKPRRAIAEASDDVAYVRDPANAQAPPLKNVNINKRLRDQAKKLGLKPGSPRWRAYVLGTTSANKKRKIEKRKKASFRECVTPGNMCQNGTPISTLGLTKACSEKRLE